MSAGTDGSDRTTTSSSRSVCRALVSSPGAPASFVVCADDVAALPSPPGAGVIEGRVRPAFTPNDRAIEALRAQGVVVSPGARVVTPTGPLQQTLALGTLAYGLLVLLGSALAAAIAVRAALVRDAPAER